MSTIVNEVCRRVWVYEKNGKGKLCDTRAQAQTLINSGEYSDHPNGDFKPLSDKPAKEEVPEVTGEPIETEVKPRKARKTKKKD